MQKSPLVDRIVIVVTAVLCVIAAASMLMLDVNSLVSDLVYAGF